MTVGNGMKSATRTAGTTDKIGPNIGTSSNSPASTPSTMAIRQSKQGSSDARERAHDQREGELAPQLATEHARDVEPGSGHRLPAATLTLEGTPMTTTTPSHPTSEGVVVSRVAPAEEGNTWTPTDRLIGIWVAWTVFALALIYVAVMALGFIAAGGLDAPLGDPAFAIMELLILVQAPLIVLLFGAFHRYAAPRSSHSQQLGPSVWQPLPLPVGWQVVHDGNPLRHAFIALHTAVCTCDPYPYPLLRDD
jgi:hypothetical protein